MKLPKGFRIRRVGEWREFPMFGSLEYSENAVLVSMGGWARSWQTTKQLQDARERWTGESYNHDGKAFYNERENVGGVIQCGGCKWFAAFDADYGLCCNAESWFDGRVTFEHGGCASHSNIEDGTVIWDGKNLRWP